MINQDYYFIMNKEKEKEKSQPSRESKKSVVQTINRL